MNASDTEANGSGEDVELLDHERRVAHFRAGYENSQAVVRFLDTKATAAVGIVPVTLAAVSGVAKWIVSEGKWVGESGASHLWIIIATVALALIGMAFVALAIRTLWCAFGALLPKAPGGTQPSLLFPYQAPEFVDRVELFMRGGAHQDEVEDYRRQVVRMGQIAKAKLIAVQNAFKVLRWLLIVGVAFIMMLGGLRLAIWLIRLSY